MINLTTIKTIISLILITFLATNVSAQVIDTTKYVAKYNITYSRDSTNVENIKNEVMILNIGNHNSIFYSKNSLYKDSIKQIMFSNYKKTGKLAVPSNIPKTKFNYNIIKDYNKNEINFYDQSLSGGKFCINEKIDSFKWNLKNKNKSISGYKCQLATCIYAGREYEAWFTTEIPFRDGPYKFSGLPGLIVKIYDTKNHYSFELISFEKVIKETKISYPKNKIFYSNTSRENYCEIQRIALKKIASDYAMQSNSANDKLNVKKQLKKNNNPIELK